MKTTELFKKHFGDTAVVSMFHPNIENFFTELNQQILLEDKQKQEQCEHVFVYKILYNHVGKNVCEKCHLVVNQ